MIAPGRDGEKAGIIAFQNEEYYYPLSVARVTGRTVVQLEKHAGTQTGAAGLIVSSAPAVAKGFVGTMLGLYATTAVP